MCIYKENWKSFGLSGGISFQTITKVLFLSLFFFLGLSNYEWVNGEEIDIVTIFENWLMKVIISCPNSLHIHFFFFLKNGLPLTEGCEFCSVCWLLVSFFLFSNTFRISQRRKYKHMYESSCTQNINSNYQHF